MNKGYQSIAKSADIAGTFDLSSLSLDTGGEEITKLQYGSQDWRLLIKKWGY